MDADALRKTKEHYNSHANLHENREQVVESRAATRDAPVLRFDNFRASLCVTAQALKARKQGKALPLKDFHNDIKRKMINRWARLPVFQAS